jgi:hypothetical protein
MASDRSLVDRALQGDRDAFEELVDNYVGLVHGIILNKVRRPDEVEDLVQDVFIKAYQELPALRERDRFAAWPSVAPPPSASVAVSSMKRRSTPPRPRRRHGCAASPCGWDRAPTGPVTPRQAACCCRPAPPG